MALQRVGREGWHLPLPGHLHAGRSDAQGSRAPRRGRRGCLGVRQADLRKVQGWPAFAQQRGKERANLVAAVGQLVCGRLPDGAVPVAAVPDAGGFRRLAGLILEDTIAAEAGVRTALVGRNAAVDGVW